jgi:hypothetical protein
MILERLAVYCALSLVLVAQGTHWTDPLYWCVLALVWVAEHLARAEGYTEATDLAHAVWQASKTALREAERLNEHNIKNKDSHNE